MRRYQVYRNIRKGAVIMGLPLNLFALSAALLVLSLIVLIFSFSGVLLLVLALSNVALYAGLVNLARNPGALVLSKPFPGLISNKKMNYFHDAEVD